MIQLVGLLAFATAGHRAPYWVCAIYLVLLAIAGIAAALFMDNLEHGIQLNTLRSVLFVRHTWVISCFTSAPSARGSGSRSRSARCCRSTSRNTAKPSSTRRCTPLRSPLWGRYWARWRGFTGPPVRPHRRKSGHPGRSRRHDSGGGVLVAISTHDDVAPGTGSFTLIGYVACFMALFILAGMGNGSVFKLIPSIFEARSRSLDTGEAERRHWARAMSGSLIGFCSAVGALGGVGINLALRESYLHSGTETSAYWTFLVSYVFAAWLTWVMYVRRPGTPVTQNADEGNAAAIAR